MGDSDQVHVTWSDNGIDNSNSSYDLDQIIFDLDNQIDLLSSHADTLDCLVSIGSGVLCGLLDILWVGSFSLERGWDIASDETDGFVIKVAKILGCKSDDVGSAVRFLEMKFPIPSDGSTSLFGGGTHHHLRDFAHHPTIVGLIFSLLTQFTAKAYGTDVNGAFLIADVPERSRCFIGKDVPTKIIYGTLTWFFHLVSDVAGSGSSAGKSGGTGIPGPVLALAKEISSLPFFTNSISKENFMSELLSKLFSGSLLANRANAGAVSQESVPKFDLRGEMGVGMEIGRQAIPVVANECIVRCYYLIRRLALEMKENSIRSIADLRRIDWDNVKPANNPTITRMLTIATGVFTTVDIGEAIYTQKYWVSINYVGVGRFAVAINEDIAWYLKARDVKAIKKLYEEIKANMYLESDNNIYRRMGEDVNIDKLGLTVAQTEILYNLEYYKTLNDVRNTNVPINNDDVRRLKWSWLDEWKTFITNGFSSFLQIEGAVMHWYAEEELIQQIKENDPQDTWFRLALLEAMLFEPFYPLGIEKDKNGKDVPSTKYKALQNVINGFKKSKGDDYLDALIAGNFQMKGYIKRLRTCYDKVLRELNEVLKMVITSLSITAVVTIIVVATAGAFAPAIAPLLVGSNFVGLSGAALTGASLAYLGGGAIAVGGAGMLGGTIAIVGGGAVLGFGIGAGVGGAVGAVGLLGKQNTIRQSAKLLVSVREIFLNDERDTAYSNSVYEKYVQNIMEIEKGLVELRLSAEVAKGQEKKALQDKIKKAEESVEAMKIAMRSLRKFISSFEEGLALE